MIHYFSKPGVALGAALLLAAACPRGLAQGPRPPARLAPSSAGPQPISPTTAMPPTYSPPAYPPPPRFSEVRTSYGAPNSSGGGQAVTAAPPAYYAAPPPSAPPVATAPQPPEDPLKLKQRFGNSVLFNRPLQQLLPQRVPPTTIVLQQVQPQAAPPVEQTVLPGAPQPPTIPTDGPSSRRAPMPTYPPAAAQTAPQPLPAAQPQALPIAQIPGGLPQGAVVVLMPAGWQPQGVAPQFAEREKISPEVPANFWPAPQRNPFGNADRGVFSWSEILDWDDENDGQPKPRGESRALFAFSKSKNKSPQPSELPGGTSKALLAGSSPTKSAPTASAAPKPSRALLSVLTASNSPAGKIKSKSKALFTIRRADEMAEIQHEELANADRSPGEPTVAEPRLAGAPRPPQPPTQTERPQEAARTPRPATSRLKSPTASESKPSPTAEARHTRWRAKGSPREMSLAEESQTTSAEAHVASHSEPVEDRTPKSARAPASSAPQPTPAAQAKPAAASGAANATRSEPQSHSPREAPHSAAKTPGSKALISTEFLQGIVKADDAVPPEEVVEQQIVRHTPAPAPAEPESSDAPRTNEVQLVAATEVVPRRSSGQQKALLPSIRPKRQAADLFLGRKPDTADNTSSRLVHSEPTSAADDYSDRATQSYYAPAAPHQAAASHADPSDQSPSQPEYVDPRQQSLAHPDAMRHAQRSRAGIRPYTHPNMPVQRAAQQSAQPEQRSPRPTAQVARRVFSPLAKPLSAIGEMTKLPSFVTSAFKRGESRTPAYDDPQAVQIARQQRAQAAVAANDSELPAEQPAPPVLQPTSPYADVAAAPSEGPSSRRRAAPAVESPQPAVEFTSSGTRITKRAVPRTPAAPEQTQPYAVAAAQPQQAQAQPQLSVPASTQTTTMVPLERQPVPTQQAVTASAPPRDASLSASARPTAATLLTEPQGDAATVRDETQPTPNVPQPRQIRTTSGKTVKIYSGDALRAAAEQHSGRRQVQHHESPAATPDP